MKVYVRNRLVSLRGSSDVVDENQKRVFVVKGKFFSLHHTKRIYNANGDKIFKLKNRFFNLWAHKVRIYQTGYGKVATVKDKVVSMKPIYLIGGTENEYRIEGEFRSRTCNISRNGQVIGTIRREITLIRDAFELEAAPEDLPFCVALVVAIDNITDAIMKHN